jgi:hypothetical protein
MRVWGVTASTTYYPYPCKSSSTEEIIGSLAVQFMQKSYGMAFRGERAVIRTDAPVLDVPANARMGSHTPYWVASASKTQAKLARRYAQCSNDAKRRYTTCEKAEAFRLAQRLMAVPIIPPPEMTQTTRAHHPAILASCGTALRTSADPLQV